MKTSRPAERTSYAPIEEIRAVISRIMAFNHWTEKVLGEVLGVTQSSVNRLKNGEIKLLKNSKRYRRLQEILRCSSSKNRHRHIANQQWLFGCSLAEKYGQNHSSEPEKRIKKLRGDLANGTECFVVRTIHVITTCLPKSGEWYRNSHAPDQEFLIVINSDMPLAEQHRAIIMEIDDHILNLERPQSEKCSLGSNIV